MKKPFTKINYSVLIKTKSGVSYVYTNKTSLKSIFKKCSEALNYFKFKPSDEVVNKILKYADY